MIRPETGEDITEEEFNRISYCTTYMFIINIF